MGKPAKKLCKIYKSLVQHQVQQVVHNLCDIFSYRHIWFQENSETFPLKFDIHFLVLYRNFKLNLQYIVQFGEQLSTTTVKFSSYNDSFQTNEIPLFKEVCTVFILHQLLLPYSISYYFNIVLLNVALYYCCTCSH